MVFHCGSNLHFPNDLQFICLYKYIATCMMACGDGNHCTIVYTCEANETVSAVMFAGDEGREGGEHRVIIISSTATSVDLLSKFVPWNK